MCGEFYINSLKFIVITKHLFETVDLCCLHVNNDRATRVCASSSKTTDNLLSENQLEAKK